MGKKQKNQIFNLIQATNLCSHEVEKEEDLIGLKLAPAFMCATTGGPCECVDCVDAVVGYDG